MAEHLVVESVVTTRRDRTNLKEAVWSIALDQRAFGPRRVVVAFARRNGRLRALAHAERTDPPEVAFAACLDCAGQPGDAVVAFCDDPVADGPPPDDLAYRFWSCGTVCDHLGLHLVDWIACDDQLFRSSRLALFPGGEWWAVP